MDMMGRVTQSDFGRLIGISQQAVSDLVGRRVLSETGTVGQWLLEYCGHMREMAAGRAADGDLDLATERAQLARSQRLGQDIKNNVSLGTYAPIELLSDVLANAAQAVIDRLEQIPADLRRVCPDLPAAARDAVMAEIASARNEMARKTAALVDAPDTTDLQEDADPVVEEADA